jgi:hypothetical protein
MTAEATKPKQDHQKKIQVTIDGRPDVVAAKP